MDNSNMLRKPDYKIKVIGVGGGGCNAVNRMKMFGVQSAEFIAINTDAQSLEDSLADYCVQIGAQITGGKGAGSYPEIGMRAAEESKEAIEEVIGDADMVFIAAGMGGGTGTGAAPIVSAIAKNKGILTVGVVTTPFSFEGEARMANAYMGVENLSKVIDTVLIIPNKKLEKIMPVDASVDAAFEFADETLRQAIQGTADLIVNKCLINLDFADVCTIMRDKGIAHMGVGEGKGENKVLDAIRIAIGSPLLDTTIDNANGVIINIIGGPDLKLNELSSSVELVRQVVAKDARIIFGGGTRPDMQGKCLATVIATGVDLPPTGIYSPFAKRNTAPPKNPLGTPVRPTQQGGPYAATAYGGFPPFGASGRPPESNYANPNRPAPQESRPRSAQEEISRYYNTPKSDEEERAAQHAAEQPPVKSSADDVPRTRIDVDIDGLPDWMRFRKKRE